MLSLPIDPNTAQCFAALLLAHVLADFTFQTNWMVQNKRKPLVLLLHIAMVFILSTALLGGVWQVALLVALAHLVIDAVKTWALPEPMRSSLTAFLIDQGAHMITLIAAALWWPGAIAQGAWAEYAPIALPLVILLAGFITSVTAGGYVVGMLTGRYQAIGNMPKPDLPESDLQDAGLSDAGHSDLGLLDSGLPDAGRLIGQLERCMIFLLVMIGQPAGVGFLIAAKSVLRLDTAKQGRQASEYVIIGTLASFAWALGATYVTLALLEIAVLEIAVPVP
ncbi:MAG: DUF3307 domain-containing protein [Pelagimonas sp.]|uniref:DUF3307 domain-containing protein n=1 Tax=Pelagimonas sp. TaxID=2073170 RepID=UPI003D6AC718